MLLTQAIASEEKIETAEPAEDLLRARGHGRGLALELARRGIVTREDLAEQAIDDLLEIEGVDAERAGALIMAARKHWFEQAAARPGRLSGDEEGTMADVTVASLPKW